MKFEDLQNQWQKEDGDAKVQISYDMLFKEISRNQRSFDREILWRDIRECIASLVGVCFLILFSVALNKWFYAAAGGMLYVAIFFIVYRRFRPKKSPAGMASLRTCVEESICEIECQMELLRNVFWWYLLLPCVTFSFTFIGCGYPLIQECQVLRSIIFFGSFVVGAILVCWWVCWLNQRAIKKELLPRKQELEDLLHSIGNGREKELKANVVNLWIAFFLSVLITLFLSTPLLFINKTSWLEKTFSENTPSKNTYPEFNDMVQQVVSDKTLPPLPDSFRPKELKILSARYGAEDQWVDVTQKVADAVHENTLSIHAGNELAGRDPLFLSSKILEVEYLMDGRRQKTQACEGDELTIPPIIWTPESLLKLTQKCPAEIGFYGKNFSTGKELAYRPDQPACLASIVKIFVLLELSRQMESGKINPQDSITITYEDKQETCSINAAIDRMIGVSDNEATTALATLVGYGRVNALAGQLAMKGISSTILPEEGLEKVLDMRVYEQKMVPESQLPPQHGTARGVVSYFELLNEKKLIDEAVSTKVLEAMNRNPMRFAPAATPAGYHSVGKGGSILWVRPFKQEYTMLGWGAYIYNEKEAIAFCIWGEWFPVDMDETQRWQWMTGLSNCIMNLLLQPGNRTLVPSNVK